jgi:hypothetical protein
MIADIFELPHKKIPHLHFDEGVNNGSIFEIADTQNQILKSPNSFFQ